MKVLITNVTGSQKEEALIDKDSGVIEFKSGEISHVFYEKSLGKTIMVLKDAPKLKEVEPTSPQQSTGRPKKKSK